MADVSGKFFSAKKVRTGVSPSSPGVEQGETLPPVNPPGTSLNSVGLTMPSAFAVANSPLTSNGTIAVTGAGTTDQYIRGDGSLQNFPSLTGYVPYTGATADVDLGTHDLTAERGTFANNGSSDTLTVNHTSGSGIGVKVTKGGNNEALLVNKTSGSGNAMAVVGGRTSLVDLSLSSVSNATGNFLTISGGVVHQRTPSETRSDVGAQAQLNGTGFVKASGTTITYDNSTYQLTSEKGQPNGYASLDGNGKVPLAQINDALIGNVNYQGLWNASTNTPTLANPPSSGTKGYYYIVSTAGTFAGISFDVGDWIISNGSAWQKVDNTDAVSSVFGRTGNVTATNGDYNTSQVTENTNLYYTEARVSANANVAANTAARHNAVTLGTANGLSLSTQQLSLQLASGSQNGALSSTDWTTFNNKENAITAGTTAQYFRGDKTFQTLNTGVVPESGNLYFTNARAIASVLTGYTSGAGTISAADTILSAIQKLNGNIGALVTGVSSVNGQTGAVTLTTTNIAEGTNLYYTEARVNANTNVAANTAARHAAVTLGTANGLGLTGQQLSLGLASAGVTGALSGTDWSTFNSKQQALNGTGFVKISGTTISYDNSTYLTTAAAASTYLPLAGGTMTGNINWAANDVGLTWSRNTDGASIKFISVGDGTGESYLQIGTSDNGNEAIVFTQTSLIRVQIDTDGLLKNGSSQKYVFENGGTWGIAITGNAGTVTNGVVTTGSYSNPSWITALSWTKITDRPTTLAGYGITDAVPSSRTITINGTAQDLSANRTFNVGTVTSVAALTLGTAGTDLSSSVANGTTTPVITLNVPTASATNRGALSAADWTTFNNKQNALTNPVTGTGTAGQVAYFNGTTTITSESALLWDSTNDRLGIGVSPAQKLDVNGISQFRDDIRFSTTNSSIGYTDAIRFVELGVSTRMTLSSGNLGLGVTPSAWSLGTTLQIGSIYGTINYSGTSAILGIVNAFYNGSSYLRQNTGTAFSLEYNISVGNALAWRMGSDDSSGTTTSLTPVMALFNSGNLLIGSPPMSDNGARLQVSGNGHFSQADANVYIQSTSGIGKNWQLQSFSDGNFYINVSGVFSALNINGSTGAATFSSSVTASSFIRSGGTSSQYLMADGSVSTLTNPVTGSGTTNTIPKFTGTTTLGNSIITDTGSLVSIDGNFRIRNSNGFNDSVNFDRTRINGMILDSSGNLILNGSSGSSRLTCYGEGYFSDGIRTIAPTGGSSENWKLGNAVNGTVNANRLIRVEIAGVGYDLVARQII